MRLSLSSSPLLLFAARAQAFRTAGFRPARGQGWSVLWGRPGDVLAEETLRALGPFQRVNHFPGTWEMGRKDRLYRSIAAARRAKGGSAFDIVPRFFLLPTDEGAFRTELAHNPGHTYIAKPVASSRGRGVRVLPDAAAALAAGRLAGECVVQRYIEDPLLIDGFKFDLRLYVAVTSLDPLRVYVHEQGLARFASRQYSSSAASYCQRRRHLTNCAVNRCCPGRRQSGPKPPQGADQGAGGAGDCSSSSDEEEEGPGGSGSSGGAASKWSLARLRRRLEADGASWGAVWEQVCDLAAKALIAAEPRLGVCARAASHHRGSFFELFGMDVLLDARLRAWLLEFNTTPSLRVESRVDARVKGAVVADLL
ncbi:hypothetical protein Rsub_00565 [Raphidocelis subcapitata]|uniref:Tubulin--tyrosine ligase-like protein 5 n=1 Tax=Raphidocelis subcapitata TaxID=307507 RepID=A0A2V0NQM9_9CHLO|nr:hypothetical protein Rsub_00565 [Raphidocelis subcapitata]|eukprot:GBF87853.1 hypothetical protein Rsub_00565 [Raphidocelis subcapitata]